MEHFGELSHRLTPFVLSEYPEFLRCFLQVKRAAALANGASQTIPQETGMRIADVCAELLETEDFEGFLVDPYSGGNAKLLSGNTNAVLAERANVKVQEVQASQSSADTAGTAMRLALWHLSEALATELTESIRLLQENKERAAAVFADFTKVCEAGLQGLRDVQIALLNVNLGMPMASVAANDNYRALVLEILKEESDLPLKRATNNSADFEKLGRVLVSLAELGLKFGKDLSHQNLAVQTPKALLPSLSYLGASNSIVDTFCQGCLLVLGRARVAELGASEFSYAAGFSLYEALEIFANALVALNQFYLQSITAAVEN